MRTRQGGRAPYCDGMSLRSSAGHRLGWVLPLLALLIAGTAAQAAGAPKLVAPVYPGAVPAVTGKAPGGDADSCEGRCYLTKDPIEKVKAFYDKAVGPLKQAPEPYGQHSYGVLLEFASRSEEGVEVSAVGIHALGPPLKAPSDPAKRREAYEKGALGWNAAWSPIHQIVYMTAWTPDMADPIMHPYKPSDVDALAKKYNRTQSYFYVYDAAKKMNRAQVLAKQFGDQAGQLQQQAMMGNIATQQSIAQSAGKEGEKISAEEMQDDPEFNRIMNRKPALSKKYVALTQKTQQQMMAGKYDDAEKTMDEADKLLRSDPEVAAFMKRYDERDKRRQAVSAKAKAQGSAAETSAYSQATKKIGNLVAQTLDKMVKEGYSTYIVVDYALEGKGVERNRAKIAELDDGLHYPPHELVQQATQTQLAVSEIGIKPDGSTPEQVAAAREAMKPAGAGKPAQAAAAKPAAAQPAAPPAQAAQPPPPQPPPAEKKNDASEAVKKGFNVLKKLF
jgi:hypothetical protein